MQLDPPRPVSTLRARLGAAACTLLASGAAGAAHGAAAPKWGLEASSLLYGEKDRTQVVEPVLRVSRLFSDRKILSLGFAYDSMTGASPTGAQPSGSIQTTTTPSGNLATVPAGTVPTSPFHDRRYAFDLGWQQPLGAFAQTNVVGHFSDEKDYRSTGVNGTFSADLLSRSLTVTLGGGYNDDQVTPEGGIHAGLTADSLLAVTSESKQVGGALFGLSRVMSRRWLASVTTSRSWENGYLTDPYKVMSLFDPAADTVTGQISEKRPRDRTRSDVLLSSVYHLNEDILYSSYRYYWDDWDIRSHTLDLRYRHELGGGHYLQPHLRYYTQTAAKFFVWGLDQGTPLPAFASADYRLSELQSWTFGLKYGVPLPGDHGEIGIRAEYMLQPGHGDRSSGEASAEEGDDTPEAGTQAAAREIRPDLHVLTLLLGYSVGF